MYDVYISKCIYHRISIPVDMCVLHMNDMNVMCVHHLSFYICGHIYMSRYYTPLTVQAVL